MKRKILLAVVCIVLALVLFTFLSSNSNPDAPHFVPTPPGFKIDPSRRLHYDFLLPSPFENGLAWITVFDTNKARARTFLYDIQRTKFIGEMLNGWPVFGSRDQAKVLLRSKDSSSKEALLRFADRVLGGKLNLGSRNREEAFVVFDRSSGKSKGLGYMYQFPGTGSRWYPSPTARYGFTCPTASGGRNVFLCDLEKPDMAVLPIRGTAVGWWDETNILFKSEDHDLSIYNVITDKTSILLKTEEIKAFLKQNGLTVDLAGGDVKPFPIWEAGQYQFYFTDTYKRWQATNGFLTKMEKPSGKLKLVAADFKFEWSDSFDSTGRYYVFSGRDVAAGDKVSAVFVRDLQSGKTRTLVEDCGSNQLSIPHWYGTDVIYSRSNKLWRVGLFNTNVTRVFPPPGE
jgi:hypothetical protein